MNPFGEYRISKAKILVTLLDLLTFEYKKSEEKSIWTEKVYKRQLSSLGPTTYFTFLFHSFFGRLMAYFESEKSTVYD